MLWIYWTCSAPRMQLVWSENGRQWRHCEVYWICMCSAYSLIWSHIDMWEWRFIPFCTHHFLYLTAIVIVIDIELSVTQHTRTSKLERSDLFVLSDELLLLLICYARRPPTQCTAHSQCVWHLMFIIKNSSSLQQTFPNEQFSSHTWKMQALCFLNYRMPKDVKLYLDYNTHV